MALPTIVNFQTNNAAAPGSSVFTKPTGLADGDVLYLVLSAFTQGDGTTASPPSGFTSLQEQVIDFGASGIWLLAAIYRKIVTNAAGEPANYTIGDPSGGYSGGWRGGLLYAVRGADTTTPEDDSGCAASTSGTLSTGSIIDSSGADSLLLMVGVAGGVSLTTPAGMTQDAAIDDGIDVKCWSQAVTSQMTSASKSSTLGSSNKWATAFVVIKPAASGAITGTPATVAVSSNVGVTGSDPVKISDRGVHNDTGTGNGTLAITNPTQIAVGNYLVARVSVDNSGTSGARPGLAFSDTRNGTWTHGTGALQDPGTASSGIATYLCYVKVTTPYQVGDVFSFAWTTGTPRTAICVEEWANIDQITPLAVVEVQANNVSSTAQPALSRTPTAVGQLMYVAAGIEGFSSYWGAQDTDTTGGSWGDVTKVEANTGTAATSVSVYGGYKVVTSTAAQTWNNTLGTTSDWAACAVVFAKAVTSVGITGTPATVAITAGSAVAAGTASVTGTPASVAISAGSATVGIGIGITGTSATVVVTAGSAILTATTAVTGTSASVAVQSTSATISVAGTFTENFTGTNDALLANGWHDASDFGDGSPMVVIESNRGSTHNNVNNHIAHKLHGLNVSGDWQIDFDCYGPLVIGNGGTAVGLLSSTTFQGWSVFIGNAVHIQKRAVGGGTTNLSNDDRPGSSGSLQNHITFTHRGSDGYMAVYVDGSLFSSATDNSQSAGNMVLISLMDTSSPTTETWIDTLVISDVITGPPGAGTNITGTSATVAITAGSATLTANTAITGTSATVAVHASSATASGNAAITGTPASVIVHAGSAALTITTPITGTSATVAVHADSATINIPSIDITGISATVTITAGVGQISATPINITGTSAIVAVTASSATVNGNATIIGTPSSVVAHAGSATLTATTAVTGTSATVAAHASSATVSGQTNITGTSATVAITAGSGTIGLTAIIIGISANIAVTAGSANVAGNAAVIGTSAFVAVHASSATLTATTAVIGTSANIAVHAGSGTIGIPVTITGTSSAVAVHAGSAVLTATTSITGTSATVIVSAGSATIILAIGISGSSAVVAVHAGTATIGVQTDITGTPASVAVHANTVTVSGHAAITCTSANITVQAGTGAIGTAGDITGTSAVITVVAGTGTIGVLTAIVGVAAIVAVIAGNGQISAEGTYIQPMQQGAIIIL